MTRLHDPEDGLIRRHYRKKGKPQVVEDQLTGIKRAPAAAFEPRAKDKALSVNVESSLRAAGESLLWGVNLEKFYAARITVGIVKLWALEHIMILFSKRRRSPEILTTEVYLALWRRVTPIQTHMRQF